MGTAKRAKEVWITFKGKRRQVRPCGIREPKERVKGYRVEIRPPSSKKKIWVGTFETRPRAQRAFDAAIYLIGKEPYYYRYGCNYFPKRPNRSMSNMNFQELRKFVQKEAKKFAEKNDHLPVNPSSLMVDNPSSTQEVVQDTNDQELLEDTNDQEPVEDFKDDQEPVEDMNYQEPVEDMVPAAYLRGLKAADTGVVNALLAYPPPESFTVFSHIQDGEYSILDLFEEDPASRLIPSPEREPQDLFDGANWSGFAADGEGGYGDHPMEDQLWWSA